ncbi:MAG: hypothetical protein WBQ41_03560 [Solirubrobacterales bacterium]
MSATKSKPKPPTAAQITKMATMRRGGATWAEVQKVVPSTKHWKSTKFAQALAEQGYDRLGRKAGKGESKARAWGPEILNGKPAKAPAKKRSRAKK